MKILKANQAGILELKKLNMKLKNTVIGFKYRLYNKMQKEGSLNLKVGQQKLLNKIYKDLYNLITKKKQITLLKNRQKN